jgi:predicted transcriptional regulator
MNNHADPDEHEYIDEELDYPSVLRITVSTMDELFDRAHDDLAGDGPATEASRSFATFDQVRRFLTPKRIELIEAVMRDPPGSIRELARCLDRNYSDVHNDVELLADHRIIHFERTGSAKAPRIPYDEIKIDLTIRPGAGAEDAAAP